MYVQEFLKNNTLKDLTDKFGIKVKEYEKFVCLNYSHVGSPKSHPIVIECRSLKLEKPNYDIASRSFDRFYNFGEKKYKKFNFEKSVVMEKVDGSIIPIWYNKVNERWEISSRGEIFGQSKINNTEVTFREAILKLLTVTDDQFQLLFKNADINYTYIFEYIGPDNFIVTPYTKSELVLLGIRHNTVKGEYKSMKEMNDFLDIIGEYKSIKVYVRLVKVFDISSFDEAMEFTKTFKNLEEGFVIWDYENDIRVKIKSKQYVAMHHIRSITNVTKESLIKVAISGEIDEFVIYFPRHKDQLEKINCQIIRIKEEMKEVFEELNRYKSQKEFAKEALLYDYSSIIFLARKNKTSILDEYDKLTDDGKVTLLNKIIF